MKEIILASASPRRKQLLELAGIQCRVIPANIDESYPLQLSPENVAEFVAKKKAIYLQNQVEKDTQDYTILAADTIVVLDGEIIGKPIDKEDAVRILSKLSGKEHKVITGVCLLTSTRVNVFSETTFVQFNTLSCEQINFYVENFKPYDKAGAYAIQEWIGAVGISDIKGDFYNVMGLPINRIVKALSAMVG